MKVKKIIKIIILIITAILIFCFIMKNFFPAEWSFITPHKQGDFVRVGNANFVEHIGEPILLNDKVVCLGVENSEYYDLKTRKFYQINHNGFVSSNWRTFRLKDDKLIRFGNYNNESVVALFDLNTFTMLKKARIIVESEAFRPVKLKNDNVMLTGGKAKDGHILKSTEIYNHQTNQIEKGPNMIVGRYKHSALLLNNGKVFIIGGKNNDYSIGVDIKATEFYNPETNKFEKGPDLTVTLPYIYDIFQDKKDDVYIFGCTFISETQCEHRIYKLADNSNAIEFVTKFYPYGNMFKLKSGKLIAAVASDSSHKSSTLATIFDTQVDKLETYLLDFPVDFYTETILLPDDTLLFIGGSSGFGLGYRQYKMAKIYDPKTNKLKTLKVKPIFPRNGHSKAILLQDGNVLIGGGSKDEKKPYAAEIYMFNEKL